jgi:hypothetical protein
VQKNMGPSVSLVADVAADELGHSDAPVYLAKTYSKKSVLARYNFLMWPIKGCGNQFWPSSGEGQGFGEGPPHEWSSECGRDDAGDSHSHAARGPRSQPHSDTGVTFPRKGCGLEVEFVTASGKTDALVSLKSTDVRRVATKTSYLLGRSRAERLECSCRFSAVAICSPAPMPVTLLVGRVGL